MSAPLGIMSLWEMIELGLAAEAFQLGRSLQSQVEQYRAVDATVLPRTVGRIVLPNGEFLQRSSMAANIAATTRACQRWALTSSLMQASSLEDWIESGPPDSTFQELAGRVAALAGTIQDEAVFRYFYAIPRELSSYVNAERPAGDAVWASFPSSREDLSEACSCIALGRNSAAVYHAMCALEPAMEVLARHVKVPWKPKVSMWNNTLDQIDKAIKAIVGGPKTKGLSERIVFLSQAASEFRYFKDGWRNDTMHARYKASDSLEAQRVLTHVMAFMVLLSSRLWERGAPHP